MTDQPRYRVIVSGNVLPEKSRADVLQALASLFNSTPATMEKLLQGKPVALTQSYERDRAEKICRAIRVAGAACRMEEIAAPQADSLEPEPDESRPGGRRAEPRPPPEQPESERDGQSGGPRDGSAQSTSTRHKEAAVLRFVGVNIEYYRRQFARFGSVERPTFALSWNWPAFFAFFLWASYRKLWRWAGLHLLGGLLLVVIVEPGFVYLLWALVWPLTANYLYYRHVCRCVLGASGEPSSSGGAEGGDVDFDAEGGGAAGGGVSRAAVGVGMILVFLSSMAFNHLITERVLERYSEATGDFGAGPGTRQRGDGSSIEEGAALSAQAAKTLATLNIIATALKAAASERALDDPELALSVVRRIVEQRQFKDAWGTAVAVRRDATGQVVLASAGPDRQFGNDDDILQYIHFDDL
ncbi:MAG: DUF2628 domain-containing protein [Gammaproteobacteria bacterium]|nr:DUF2628 domain-containing protein [Gammaproteobacteria bacterium]